jgi:pullulanase/glycogen debranching enzyme
MERAPGLREYHKQLIALRKANTSLHSRQWAALQLEAVRDQVAFGYLRYHSQYKDPLLVLLNFNSEPTEVATTLPEGFSTLADKTNLRDLFTGESVVVGAGNDKKVALPGYGVRILTAS